MLTSSNQYLRPEYLTPLPTTVSFSALFTKIWILFNQFCFRNYNIPQSIVVFWYVYLN